MSTVEESSIVTPEARESGLLRREFAADLSVGDGRTVDVRIVPYGERVRHNDGNHGRGGWYEEEFVPGVFNHQLNAANRVHANIEHDASSASTVGYGVLLREEADGFYGSFRLLDTPAGETARQLIEAGALDGVSLEAKEVRTIRGEDGVLRRAKANLRAIAFTRFGSYAGAKVLALREAAEEETEGLIDEAILPVDMDPDLIKRLQAQGVELPSRYQAHPAETDTPAASGTSDDGTRQSQTDNASED
jgi:HK97 family phage prohead protease